MSYELKKRVIGLKNPTFQARNENSDDVGVDQTPDLRFAVPQCLLGTLAVAHVDNKDDPLACLSFEKCAADQNWDAAAVLATILLLVRSAGSGPAQLGQRILVGGSPLRGRQFRPTHPTRGNVIIAVAQHPEKGIIGFDDPPTRIRDKDADDVRVDQAPDSCLSLLEIVVQAGILQCDRGLRGEQLQNRDPSRREDARGQVVLEVERADKFGLIEQWQAENGPGLALTDIGIDAKR